MTKKEETNEPFDVIIIGGSFAGLAAATQLARARRKVLVIDGREHRNRFAKHSHGFLTQDGKTPDEILGAARSHLAAYPTASSLRGLVTEARRLEDGRFEVRTAGECRYLAQRLVLALGVRDILPEIEGLSDLWGTGVFHCPYCHGYEVRDRPLAVLGNGEVASHQAMLLREWSDDIVIFTHGPAAFEEAQLAAFARKGITIEETPLARLVPEGDELAAVELQGGRRIPRGGMLIAPRSEPSTDIAQRLGCEIAETPTGIMVKVDEMKETTVKGVFAAGDFSRPFSNVTLAVADGMMAGVSAHRSLVFEM
jgi:thioredoxin reductase (NADPH)